LANSATIITAEQSAAQAAAASPAPRTGIIGVGGYAGGELARILFHHPRFATTTPTFFGRAEESKAGALTFLEDLHPQLATAGHRRDHQVVPFSWERAADLGIEVLFLATPHEQSREWVPTAIAQGIKVIDLSGAWRLQHNSNRAIYRLHDANPALAAQLQTEAAYGCPELHRDQIRSARLVANPGCYATSIILALAPLVQAALIDVDHGIICDSKSGVSGAGKAPTANTHFMRAADNLSAYAVFGHRHTGEMLEQLNLTSEQIQFTPHLLPIPRGILSTIYLRLKQKTDAAAISSVFETFYANSPLVRLHHTPHLPEIQHIVRTNFCDLGFALAPDGKRLLLVSVLDNLLKGAAGQAVQNMNLMCGYNEEEGLL
jgi:N-acetyl-gamma-glutamyl-phosphate reductase